MGLALSLRREESHSLLRDGPSQVFHPHSLIRGSRPSQGQQWLFIVLLPIFVRNKPWPGPQGSGQALWREEGRAPITVTHVGSHSQRSASQSPPACSPLPGAPTTQGCNLIPSHLPLPCPPGSSFPVPDSPPESPHLLRHSLLFLAAPGWLVSSTPMYPPGQGQANTLAHCLLKEVLRAARMEGSPV